MSGFDEVAVAAKFRDVMKELTTKELDRLSPAARYADVQTIDYANMKAEVQFIGESELISVTFGQTTQPTNVDQRVRIAGRRGDRYIAELLSAPTWTAPTFANSWVNYGGSFIDAGYRRTPDGRVLLRGMAKDGTTTNPTTMFTLPVGFRPIETLVFGVDSGGAHGRVDIEADGDVVFRTGSNSWVSFNSVTFDTL